MAVCSGVNRKLLPVKVLMFGWFGAFACISPFITVHMKELGLTIKETTVIYSLIPISQFLIPPTVGLFVDKLGRYRNILMFSLLMVFLLAIGMLYVPAIANVGYHEQSIIKVSCDDENVTRSCKPISIDNSSEYLMYIESCYFTCNTEILPINNSWPIVSNVTNSLISRECGYDITSMCALITTTEPSNCSITCKGLNTTDILSEDIRDGLYLTFCLFATLRIAFEVFVTIVFGLVNASAVALTENDTKAGEFGKQRFWAMFALAIFSPLAGILIDIIGTESGVTSYAPAFHIHNSLILVATIAAWFVDFEIEDRPTSCIEAFKNIWKLIKFPSVLFFILVLFWLGTVWGFLETFLFLFLKELGSPAYMLGLTITVGSLSSLPFLYYAKCFVSKFGYANLMSLAVFMYFVRCVGCSYLSNPWWIMPFEAMEIFTYHLMWVTAVTYTAHICPPGLLATTQGFIDGLHFGVGQGSGSLIGGSLISTLGFRQTFRIIGGVSGSIAFTYSVLHVVWLRKSKKQPQMRGIAIKTYGKQNQGKTCCALSDNDTKRTSAFSLQSGDDVQEQENLSNEILEINEKL